MSPTRTKAAPSPLAVPAAGLLEWGQAGNYNAADDRQVIAALYSASQDRNPGIAGSLFRARGGLIVAPTLTPGSALSVNIGPWMACVDCGDGTKAIIGPRSTTAIDIAAGGGSARVDVLWADITPDAAQYQVGIITEAAMAGRSGVFLGLIFVPAGAATSAACTLNPSNARILGLSKAWQPNRTITATTPSFLASMTVPAYDAEPGAVYEVQVWGSGGQGSTRQQLTLQCYSGNTAMALVTFGTTAWTAGNALYRFHAVVRLVCLSTGPAATWQSFITATTTEFQTASSPSNGNIATATSSESTNTYTIDSTRDLGFGCAAFWGSATGSPNVVSRMAMSGRIA